MPTFRCTRCVRGLPPIPRPPPYIPAPDDDDDDPMTEPEYLRDVNGIPLPGQVVPFNLEAYMARDRPIDKHTVVHVLKEYAIRVNKLELQPGETPAAFAARSAEEMVTRGKKGQLAFQLLHSVSREHRSDHRLRQVAAAWVTTRAVENRFDERGGWGKCSLAHQFASNGQVAKLHSLVAAGVPAWKMLIAKSWSQSSPLDYALQKTPSPGVVDFFLDAANWLEWPTPQPVTLDVYEAGLHLPDVLSRALWRACSDKRVHIVEKLLAHPASDPAWRSSESLWEASLHGCAPIVQMLLADGRADPASTSQRAIRWAALNGHTEAVAVLLKDPRVEPRAQDGYALKMAVKRDHKEVVALLKADPRMAPWAHLEQGHPSLEGLAVW